VIAMIEIPCNWLQCMENTPDPVHTEYLHGHYFTDWLTKNDVPKTDRRWNLARGFETHFLKHDYALGTYGIDRRWLLEGQSKEKDTWGAPQVMPFPDLHVTSGGGRHTFGWRVPVDDTTTMEVILRCFDPGPEVTVPPQATIPYVVIPMVDDAGRFTALHSVTGQDVMAWSSQGAIVDRSKEHLADTDRGVILFRQLLQAQLKRVEDGLDPINVFRDPAQNVQIDLPVPWDRGYAWGFAKDGSYVRGSVTAGDPLPQPIIDAIEDLFVEAAAKRTPVAAQ
jgi:5,5'-dehydrodivanillate O-demethylase